MEGDYSETEETFIQEEDSHSTYITRDIRNYFSTTVAAKIITAFRHKGSQIYFNFEWDNRKNFYEFKTLDKNNKYKNIGCVMSANAKWNVKTLSLLPMLGADDLKYQIEIKHRWVLVNGYDKPIEETQIVDCTNKKPNIELSLKPKNTQLKKGIYTLTSQIDWIYINSKTQTFKLWGNASLTQSYYGIRIYYNPDENKKTELTQKEDNPRTKNPLGLMQYACDWETFNTVSTYDHGKVHIQSDIDIDFGGNTIGYAEMDVYAYAYDEYKGHGENFFDQKLNVTKYQNNKNGIYFIIVRSLDHKKTLFLAVIVDKSLPDVSASYSEGNVKNGEIYTRSNKVRLYAIDRHLSHYEIFAYIDGEYRWIDEYKFVEAGGTTQEYTLTPHEVKYNGSTYNNIKKWKVEFYDEPARNHVHTSHYNGKANVTYVTFDDNNPTFQLESKNNEGDRYYTNKCQTISFADKDSPLAMVRIKHKGILGSDKPTYEETHILDKQYLDQHESLNGYSNVEQRINKPFEWKIEKDSLYEITVVDFAGNETTFSITTLTKSIDDDSPRFHQRYTKSNYYRVSLNNEFGDKAGKYLFLNYDDALAFAEAMEEKAFMKDLGNSEYKYFTLIQRDKNAMQIYRDINAYKLVLRHYAKQYVSSLNRSLDGVYKEYIASAKCMVRDGDNFVENYSAFCEKEANNPYNTERMHPEDKIDLKYYSEIDIQIRAFIQSAPNMSPIGELKEINSNETIYDAITRHNLPLGGVYKVTKNDICGNQTTFFFYLDAETPTANVSAEKGENSEDLFVDKEFVSRYNGSLRYTSFTLNSFSDDIDNDMVMAEISGGVNQINERLFPGDETITLSAKKGGKGGGVYTIKIYDRSGNVLSFSVIIAEGKPYFTATTLKHKGDAVTFTIYPGNNNNLSSIHIYKVHYDNTAEELSQDNSSPAKEVNIINVEYTFKIGGTYRIVLTDIFGQKSKTPDFVFSKGLPQGYLSVAERSITNKNVTFTFNHTKYSLEVLVGTEKIQQEIDGDNLKEVNKSDAQKTCTYEITAKPGRQDLLFTFRLYESGNKDNFRNYEFIMDTRPPSGHFTDENGVALTLDAKDKVHTGKFMLECKEYDAEISYTLDGKQRYYDHGEVLSENGNIFKLTDKVGNTLSGLEITIDTMVSYEIKGKYKVQETDGTIISNKPLSLSMTEEFERYTINGDRNTQNNVLFEKDGVYEIYIEDKYKNTTTKKLIIDQTPPTALVSNKLTKDNVTLRWELHADAWLYKNDSTEGKQLVTASTTKENNEILSVGELIEDEGWYTLSVTDSADNVTEIQFQIKRTVYADVSVPQNAVTTDSVSFQTLKPEGFLKEETIKRTVLFNGTEIEHEGDDFEKPGIYQISVRDVCDNVKVFSFEIIRQKMNHFNLSLPDGHTIEKETLNGELITEHVTEFKDNGVYSINVLSSDKRTYNLEFQINNIKPQVSFKKKKGFMNITKLTGFPMTGKLYRNGVLVQDSYNFKPLEKSGKYVLKLEDEFGNTNEYSFKFIKTLNPGGIIGILIVLSIIAIVVSIGLFKRFKNKNA